MLRAACWAARQIEIVEYDDRGLVDDGAAMAELIAADDSILGVPCMDFQSTVALVVGPIYQEAGIPAISNTSSHPDLSLIGEYVLRNNTTDYFEALNTIEACYLTGARKIAYIGEETDFGVSAGENMKAAVEQIAEKDPPLSGWARPATSPVRLISPRRSASWSRSSRTSSSTLVPMKDLLPSASSCAGAVLISALPESAISTIRTLSPLAARRSKASSSLSVQRRQRKPRCAEVRR